MSQAAAILPGSPLTGAVAAADINAEMAAIISKFSGTTAPPLGPGVSQALVVGQDWLDTSVTPNVWRKWDGAQWCPLGNIDPTLHTAGIALPWRNIIGANGGFEVWQRGAGNSATFAVGASSTAYTADRWYLQTQANQASTVSAATPLSTQGSVAGKISRNSGQTGTGTLIFAFPLDVDEIARTHGQILVLSLLAKAGANWSPTSGTLNWSIACGSSAGPAKRGATPYTGETLVLQGHINISPSQQAFATTVGSVIVPTGTTQMELFINWNPVGTAGSDDSITIDNVQLEVGSMASPFELMPLDLSLMMCKRHFWKTFLYSTAPAQNTGINTGEIQFMAAKSGVATEFVTTRHPVSMRAAPIITTYNPAAANAQARDETANVDCSGTGTYQLNSEVVGIQANGNAATTFANVIGVHATLDAGI